MALRQTYSSLCSLSSLNREVAASSMSKISTKPCTQLPSSLKTQTHSHTAFEYFFWIHCENILEIIQMLNPGVERGWSPVQAEVGGKNEPTRVVHRPPHEPQHQHLQPAALQQVHLVEQAQVHKSCKDIAGPVFMKRLRALIQGQTQSIVLKSCATARFKFKGNVPAYCSRYTRFCCSQCNNDT